VTRESAQWGNWCNPNLDLSAYLDAITIIGLSFGRADSATSEILLDYNVEIKINARHGELSEAVYDMMRSKVEKLPRFFDRTTGIRVVADLSKSDNTKVEIIVSAEETNDFFASDTGSNVIVALDNTISKIEQQLRKHKEKLKGHRSRDNENNREIE
jgi:putative sigma-54 modulation protein